MGEIVLPLILVPLYGPSIARARESLIAAVSKVAGNCPPLPFSSVVILILTLLVPLPLPLLVALDPLMMQRCHGARLIHGRLVRKCAVYLMLLLVLDVQV